MQQQQPFILFNFDRNVENIKAVTPKRSYTIPFNKPFLTGKEPLYIIEAVYSGQIAGNGGFTRKCQAYFEQRWGFKKTFLTSSCTDALEMTALLSDIQPGDEVIMPSYTFVSTANAFMLRGAKIVFADSESGTPNIDAAKLEELVTARTRAIVVVHYGGAACDMERISELCRRRNILLIEDAAHSIDAYYKGRPLGSIGNLATFSFHETKNVISGEGGLLVVNDERFINRAEVLWEKGTNRAAFFRGEVAKYRWVDVGSSFLPSDLIAAFLYAQLENLDQIQNRRVTIWRNYREKLSPLEKKGLIKINPLPESGTINGHLFYVICRTLEERTKLIEYLAERGILAVFHYQPLHSSPFFEDKHDGRSLPNADRYSDCLLRLPLFYTLTDDEQMQVISCIMEFYKAWHIAG